MLISGYVHYEGSRKISKNEDDERGEEMPNVRPLTEEARWAEHNELIADSCLLVMDKNGVTQRDIARFLGLGDSAICMQFAKRKLTLDVVSAVIFLTGVEPNQILKIRR